MLYTLVWLDYTFVANICFYVFNMLVDCVIYLAEPLSTICRHNLETTSSLRENFRGKEIWRLAIQLLCVCKYRVYSLGVVLFNVCRVTRADNFTCVVLCGTKSCRMIEYSLVSRGASNLHVHWLTMIFFPLHTRPTGTSY